MDDCEFFEEEKSGMSFISDSLIETICIQSICQPIVEKLISNAIKNCSSINIRTARSIDVVDVFIDSPSKVLCQPQVTKVISDVKNDIEKQESNLFKRL